MKTIKGDLILKKDTTFNEDLKVEGDIKGDFSLIVKGDLNCSNLNCWDLNCRNLNCSNLNCSNLNCLNLDCLDLDCLDLNCWNLDCWNLKCRDLNCLNLNCRDLTCRNLDFYAVAIAYNSFKCKSWKARRTNHIIKCLDGDIEITKDKLKGEDSSHKREKAKEEKD